MCVCVCAPGCNWGERGCWGWWEDVSIKWQPSCSGIDFSWSMRSHLQNPISWQSTTEVKAPVTASIPDVTAQGRSAGELLANPCFSFFLSVSFNLINSGTHCSKGSKTRWTEELWHSAWVTGFWHFAYSTPQHRKHLPHIHISVIVNYDGAEHTVTKLLTQRDTSSENKLAGQLARTVGWQLAEMGGRWATTQLLLSRLGSNGCSV